MVIKQALSVSTIQSSSSNAISRESKADGSYLHVTNQAHPMQISNYPIKLIQCNYL